MAHNHNHDHEHEEVDQITLTNPDGSEGLYDVIMRIDAMEDFGKNYMLLAESGIPDDEEADVYAFSYVENEDGTEGNLEQVPEDADDEWDMIEETFNTIYLDDDDNE
jgi:uncharacterized protein YrzB (UPF0473 family)